MAEIRDGLTTDMKYAVVATARDFGDEASQHGDDYEFWGMLKPRYEAYKIVEVMRSWGAVVYPVGPVARVAGQVCYPSLAALPEPVDCAVISLPRDRALALVDEVVAARIPTVWLQFGAKRDVVRDAFEARGVRVVAGCVLLHWNVDHVSGMRKGRHVCFMHGNLNRTVRIRIDENGVPQRVEPTDPRQMPFNRESYGTRLLAPFWPEKGV